MIFSRTDKLKITELANAETSPLENHQDNVATPLVNTQPSPTQSPLEETSVASSAPLSRPLIEAGDASLQAQEGDCPDVHLLGTD